MPKNAILQRLHFDTYDPAIASDIDEFEKAKSGSLAMLAAIRRASPWLAAWPIDEVIDKASQIAAPHFGR